MRASCPLCVVARMVRVGPGCDTRTVQLDPAWERRREPGPEAGWEDVFDLDFWAGDGALGGYIRLAIRPDSGGAAYWACLVGEGRPLVSVIEAEAPVPRPPTLEFRTSGLWADITPQTPFSHMTVGLEAFGLAFDDPAEILGRGWGEREALGFDLEWEDEAAPHLVGPGPCGLQIPARVHGEILVGRETIDFDGWGTRRHRWGVPDPDAATVSAAGRLSDGTWFHIATDGDVPAGWLGDPAVELAPVASVTRGGDALAEGARVRLGEHYLAGASRWQAPAVDHVGGTRVEARRSLTAWTTGDGRQGFGWLEERSPG